MTHSEAIQRVDMMLMGLGLQGEEGKPLLPEEVGAVVWRQVGEAWGQNLSDFTLHNIPPALYTQRCQEMIGKFREYQFTRQVEKTLLKTR